MNKKKVLLTLFFDLIVSTAPDHESFDAAPDVAWKVEFRRVYSLPNRNSRSCSFLCCFDFKQKLDFILLLIIVSNRAGLVRWTLQATFFISPARFPSIWGTSLSFPDRRWWPQSQCLVILIPATTSIGLSINWRDVLYFLASSINSACRLSFWPLPVTDRLFNGLPVTCFPLGPA